MLCTICATRNAETALFCQACGNSLEALRTLVQALHEKSRPLPVHPDGGPVRLARLLPMRHGLTIEPGLPLGTSPLLVGRFSPHGGPVDLDLATVGDARGISRRHACLSYRDGCWHVRDLGSSNGTFVRQGSEPRFGEKLAPDLDVPLTDGDELAFGNQAFVFREENA
jgi:hypothetical protein